MLHAIFFFPFFWPFWGFHGLGGLIFLIIIVALIFGPRRYWWGYRYHPYGWHPAPGSRAEALSILEARYARGEIQREEYLQKKQDLGG